MFTVRDAVMRPTFDSILGLDPPRGFNFDLLAGDEPVIDNPESEEYNVPDIVKRFVSVSQDFAKGYATNNIMFPMGDDFNYQAARSWFKNMDKLIEQVNKANKGLKVF